jgi:cytochrome c peroxidase
VNRRILSALLLLSVVAALLVWYSAGEKPVSARPIGQTISIPAPLGLPPVPVSNDNPPTAETVDLGRRLYYDTRLSADNTISCSTCHDPGKGFADPRPVSLGVQSRRGTRNSPTVLNSVYYSSQFWDGRAASLEQQAGGPMQNPVEMAHTLSGVVKKLSSDPSYVRQFDGAFGPGGITIKRVVNAISTFERTLVSGNSPFDRWYYGHDEKAVSDSVKRGFEVFRDPKKGNCESCHTVNQHYALFTDNKFHNIGIGAAEDKVTDRGRFDVTHADADTAAFKTPTLRNIAVTAPYFHDGSRRTLKEVMDFYIGGGNSNPHLDKEVHALDVLTALERADLLAFMEALTGDVPANSGPPSQNVAQQRASIHEGK